MIPRLLVLVSLYTPVAAFCSETDQSPDHPHFAIRDYSTVVDWQRESAPSTSLQIRDSGLFAVISNDGKVSIDIDRAKSAVKECYVDKTSYLGPTACAIAAAIVAAYDHSAESIK